MPPQMLAPIAFFPALAGGVILFFLLERLTSSVIGLIYPSPQSHRAAASERFLVSCFEASLHLLFSLSYALVNLLSSLLSVLAWVSVLLILGSILFVAYEQSPWVWTDLIRAYNAFLGPFFQGTVIQILSLFNLVFQGLIPFWNGAFFFVSRVMQGFLLPTMVQEAPTLKSLGLALLALTKSACVSLFNWIQSAVVDCPASRGDACFDMAQRTLDLVTPMAGLRDAVVASALFAQRICTPVGPILDILTYPFMDLNLAVGVHSLANAALYLVVHVPDITLLRCTRYGSEAALMCTPDLEPVFAFLVSGVSSLGALVDNWLDVVYTVVQGALGFSTNACDQISLAPPFLTSPALHASLFGANRTAVVGLTGWLMAVTDGAAVAYYGRGNLRVASWPAHVNVSYGLAAVTYAASSNLDVTSLSSSAFSGSTAILGCSCAGQLQITCTILPYEGLLANQTSLVPVFSHQAGGLTCQDVDIVVQSVRWPATRFSSPSAPPDCALRSTCNQVDATVWVVPRRGCGAESTACACFPFCAAARLTASQASPLVLYGAEEWRNKVHMMRRDCNLQSGKAGLNPAVGVADSAGAASAGVSSTQAPSMGDAPQYAVGGAIACTDSLAVTSRVNRSLHPAYDAPTPAFLRDPLAPFVITGDTLLTSVKHGDGQYTVRVERLTGATGTEYTLSTVTSSLPAYPPPDVPSALFSQFPRDHLTTPYARQATLAVSSRSFVFYAVNPAMQVYDAYLNYCRNNQRLPQFGLIMTSSFSPIRVWRVDAYRRCDAGGCGADLVSQADLPDAFSSGASSDGAELTYDCARSFNEGVEQLEYINENNIAVTVRRTDVTASFVEHRTYWLNAQTMQLNTPEQGPWQDRIQSTTTALGAYTLCPALQVLPELGTLAAGLINAAIHLVKAVVGAVVYFPGIINLWSSGTVCPLHTRGHSVLQQCGSEAFLLDDFFASLQASTNVFWSSLALLSAAVGRTTANTDASEFVQNALNGLSRYGAGSIDLWTASFKVLGVMKAGPSTVIGSMPTTLLLGAEGAGAWMQGGFKVSANTLGWARFGYTSLVKIAMTITQNVLLGQPVGSGRAWRIVVNILDEMRGQYEGDVVDSMRQSCAGISLMMGLTNPWAVFVYQQCIAANTALSTGVDLTLSIFNLAPFASCMCSGSSGQVFGDYARIYCVPEASTRLRPVLLRMIQASAAPTEGSSLNSAQRLCQGMIDYTKSQMVAAVQPWFDAQFASMDALGASVDYAMSWLDPSAGQCLNYNQDPDVVVIMPYPVDYFQACGSTSLCRAKCAGVWDAFDAANTAGASFTQGVSVGVESLFFPSMTVDSFAPMAIWAVMEPSGETCARVCAAAGTCAAVAGVRGGAVLVQYYCVPRAMTASVYRTLDPSLEWALQGSSAWAADLQQLQFADADGRFLVALVSPGTLLMANAFASQTLATLASPTLQQGYVALLFTGLQVFLNPPFASIHLNTLVRTANGQIAGQNLHRKTVVSTRSFPSQAAKWAYVELNSPVGLFAQLQGYSASQASPFNPGRFLLLPQSDGLPVNLLDVTWDAKATNGVTSWFLTSLPVIPQGLGALLSAGEILSQNCLVDPEGAYIAFAGAPPSASTAWLSQLRVTGASAASFASQQVPVRVSTTTRCSVQSCLGCPDGAVQSLCDAVQACTVVNCIGTPVNMRRVLCQLGQTLADESRQNLAVLFGGWVVFVDMFMVMMDLSLQKGLTGITITFPDDSFFGYVCTVKDQQAHFISIFTSAVNNVVQVAHSAMVYLEGGAHTIDSNFNALVTMPITALTSFLYQVFLGPIYMLIVAQKIMMCNVQGVVAVFDPAGFTVAIGDATLQAASDALVGQCLTQNFATRSANPTDASNARSTAQIVTQVAQTSAVAVLPSLTFRSSTLNSVMHMLDAQISYLMGILSALADMLASLDLAHCKMPDYFLNQTVLCACGDHAYDVHDDRRREGLAELALWCTGTLSLLDTSNRPYVVYNPYSYAQLQERAAGADAYLACMSSKTYLAGRTDCHPPADPVFQAQGVSVLTVLTACKNNYLNKQWDKGAGVLFNRSLFQLTVRGAAYPPLPASTAMAAACLIDPASAGGCMDAFLRAAPEVYFKYQNLPTVAGSQHVAACQVFTGPAANTGLSPVQTSAFRACLDQYADSNCQISSNLWTPQSENPVPVAQKHAVYFVSEPAMQEAVEVKFQAARDLVLSALARLKGYNDTNVKAVFFSPEGDIMHQMMDCVFMGPYNRVNYWAGDSQGHLPVPAWHRDANGTSRAVDPRACVQASPDKAPPYSCGSPARQSVIRYFFRQYLDKNQGAVMVDIVTNLTQQLALAWADPGAYPCLCPNGTHSLTCCAADNWLPSALDLPYQTVSADVVLRALTLQVRDFYRHALEEPGIWTGYLDAATLASYDWGADPVRASIVMKEGLYRTDQPVVRYDSTEARSPLITTSLWHQCHGLLSQLFFTIPMLLSGGQWVPRNLPDSLDGIRGLDAFVSAAVHEAYLHSPLYRHYNVSYVPSDSRLCRKNPPQPKPPTLVKADPFSAGGALLLDTSAWPSLPAYGTDAFPLASCFCGWRLSGSGDSGACFPPDSVCQALPALCPSFPLQSASAAALLKAQWAPAWPCPLLALSDQSGAMDAGEMDDWLLGVQRNYTVSGRDLLKRGRSGLRVGNFANLSLAGQMLPPTYPKAIDPLDASLPFCASDYGSQAPLLDADARLRAFVTRLFPVAQGIHESGTTVYCLRYTVEAALLEALALAMQADASLGPTLGRAYAAQRLTSDLWRVRCEGQIALLALCKGLDAFQPPIDVSHRTFPCPFSISLSNNYSDVYMTPGCLVHTGGRFYDPCNCPTFACGPSRPYFNHFTPSCQIPFDPRNMTADSIPLGGWKVSPLEVFDQAGFAASALASKDAVGNLPRGADWTQAEGFLNTTGRHCDALADWWPQDQTVPVGYHATTPCASDDIGYRTFDSAFAVERTTVPGEFTLVRLVYEHDLTRDAAVVDTQLGGGGVCRASNLGLPLIQTNQMRICTRQQAAPDTLDPAIPGAPAPAAYGQEQCSADSTTIPWFDPTGTLQDSALHSVGTVPNMPPPGSATYPASTSNSFGIGPRNQVLQDLSAGGNGWGSGCSDFAIRTCAAASDCPGGFFCLQPAGVCMSSDFSAASGASLDQVRCIRHSDCLGGYMCDGTGACTQGGISYLNGIDTSVEATVFAEKCDETSSDTYYTDGASPWEYVPDWLPGHGMCANKNWYYYSVNLNGVAACGSCSGTSCAFNSRTCSLALNGSVWWPQVSSTPKQFAVQPTICDRDYEHLRGPGGLPMVGCTPSSTVTRNKVIDNSNTPDGSIGYAGLFRNYATDGSTSIARMPYSSANSTGFLGYAASALNPQTASIKNCDNFQNCHAHPFTFNGAQVTRTYWPQNSFADTAYSQGDAFRCGVMSYYDGAQNLCILDRKLFPLYNAFCNPRETSILDTCTCTRFAQDAVGCTPVVSRAEALRVCGNIQASYTADYATIQANNRNLQALFGVFLRSDGTLSAHLSGTACFDSLFQSMQSPQRYGGVSSSLHYPFTFALYEIPLAWVYQCSFLAGITVDPSLRTIPCPAYEQAQTLAVVQGQPASQPLDATRLLAGYRRADIVGNIQAFNDSVRLSVPNISDIPRYSQVCRAWGVGQCEMTPYCAGRQVWLPRSTLSPLGRQLLAVLYDTLCNHDAKVSILDRLGMNITQALSQLTYLDGFAPAPLGDLPTIPALLYSILQQCTVQGYRTDARWPFSLSYPTVAEGDQDAQLQACFDNSRTEVLNSLTLNLARYHTMYSNVDRAYAPQENTEKLVVNSKTLGTQACIFPNLYEEYMYYNVPTTASDQGVLCSTQAMDAPGFNLMCGKAVCHRAPLVYQTGPQACQYPEAYGSLSDLLDSVWRNMQGAFIANLRRRLSAFQIATPYEFGFFRYNNLYFQGWTYDVTQILTFLSNVNPDTTKAIMCTITPPGSVINFTTCNDPNYAALKAFTAGRRQRGAPLVPRGKQLNWKASSAFLAQGAVFAFASSARPGDQVFLGSVFNDSARCGIGELMRNRVCLLTGQGVAASSVRPWVPWMSGQWNPYDACDVQPVSGLDDGQEAVWPYDPIVCPQCSDAQGAYRSAYMYPYSSASCDARKSQRTTFTDVQAGAPTNLCHVTLKNSDSICMNPQGMVGGNRGQPVLNHPRMPHLYGLNNITGWPLPGGIFPRGKNPLFGEQLSGTGAYGVLNIPLDEIGAVGIGLEVAPVTGSVPYLRVAKIPLQPQSGYMGDWASGDAKTWVPGLRDAFLAEDALHAAEQANRGSTAWDCPVRRMAFYSGAIPGSNFAPPVPSPGRARRMFYNITEGLSTHPTQKLQRNSTSLGGYTTGNGFCYCPTVLQSAQAQCLTPLSDTSSNCSLARTIQGLQGQWIQSVVFAPQAADGTATPCQMQYDWPYLDGQLRDGTAITGRYALASDTVHRQCHLLDRLRPFQYRYKVGAPPLPVKGTSTLNPGGVCHTGRAARLTPAIVAKLTTTRCVKQSETPTDITVACEDGTSQTLSKEQSTPLDRMVQAVQAERTRCDRCSPPPTFVNSRGDAIPPESSFGIPFRVSASRAAAEDLMGMLGPNASSLINRAEWVSESFMQTLLLHPERLFLNAAPTQPPKPASPDWPSRPWVFCNTTEDLQAGRCQGTIPEAAWRQDRFQSCHKEIRAQTRNDPSVMAAVDVCMINADLQNLCTAVSQAQALVREANCLASGNASCALKPFLYQPSMWDVSNQEFVHGTVSGFYTRIAPGACPSVVDIIIANNEAVLNRCAATPVTAMHIALQACRDVVDAMAIVLFYLINILVDGMMMAFSGNKAALQAQIVYYWQSMIKVIQDLVKVLGDLMFDMLFHMGATGQKIYDFLHRTCGLANTAYRYWLDVWCGVAINMAPSVLGAIRQMAQMCQTGFSVVNSAMDAIFTTVGLDALAKMQSMGFTSGFQRAFRNDQSRSKQDNLDAAKKSQQEGLSADKAQTNAKSGRAKKSTRNTFGDITDNLERAGAMAVINIAAEINPAMGLLTGIASSIIDAQMQARLMSLYPDNWTLFDFEDIYFAIDTLEYYLTSDRTCLNYQQANITQILNCTFPSLASASTDAGAQMVATRCWADAQRDVGISNLLSCTESDTCYRSLTDMSQPLVCGACPDAGPGYSVFGCSSLTKMCTCSTPTTKATRCTSNDQCYYGTATCQLVTGLNDMSYGNQPCASCTKQVQCLVADSTGVGTCGCVYQSQPLQKCGQTPGRFVPMTSPNSMCGYLVGADKSKAITALNWDSLSLARCLYLNPAYIYCAQVYQGGNALSMAVGLGMAPLSAPFRSRRLLARAMDSGSGLDESIETDEGHRLLLEDWNGTAEPCSSLAHLYQEASRHGAAPQLGPTDTLQLHACAYWRGVGRRTIERYNLTSLTGRDGFLLSAEDFAEALAQRWVLMDLLRNPEALLFAAAHSPLLRPLRTGLLVLRAMAMDLMLDLGERVAFRLRRNSTEDWARDGVEEDGAQHAQETEGEEQDEEDAFAEEDQTEHAYNNDDEPSNGTASRGLLQAGSNAPSNTASNTNTNIKFANTWLAGPFTWPPPFLTQLASSRCNLASALLQIIHDLLSVLTRYFWMSYTPPRPPSRRLWDNLPNLTCYAGPQPSEPTTAQDSWIHSAYHGFWGVIGFQPGYARQFLSDNAGTNLFTITTSLLKCDFEAVTFCTNHRKDLTSTAVLGFLLYILAAYVSSLLGMPILGTLLITMGFIPLVLWYAYGMALTCTPMLPTCLMEDVIYTLNQLVPSQLTIPEELQVSPTCLADTAKSACLVPCTTAPMAFLGWRDTLAYGACYISTGLCRTLADAIGNWDALAGNMRERANQIEGGAPSLVSACTFCFWITLVKLIPLIALLVVGLAGASFLVYVPCVLLPKLLPLVAEAVLLLTD